MKNLNFRSQSNIFLLKHQTEEALEINDSEFDNITFGCITMGNFDSALSVKSLAKFSNITATNNDIFIRPFLFVGIN